MHDASARILSQSELIHSGACIERQVGAERADHRRFLSLISHSASNPNQERTSQDDDTTFVQPVVASLMTHDDVLLFILVLFDALMTYVACVFIERTNKEELGS